MLACVRVCVGGGMFACVSECMFARTCMYAWHCLHVCLCMCVCGDGGGCVAVVISDKIE